MGKATMRSQSKKASPKRKSSKKSFGKKNHKKRFEKESSNRLGTSDKMVFSLVQEVESLFQDILKKDPIGAQLKALEYFQKTKVADHIFFWVEEIHPHKELMHSEGHETSKIKYKGAEAKFPLKQEPSSVKNHKSEKKDDKQKFLSTKKTTKEEFEEQKKVLNIYSKKKEICFIQNKNLYMKFTSSKSIFYFSFLKCNKKFFQNELWFKVFISRLKGLFLSLEKVRAIQNLNHIDDVTGLFNQRYLDLLLDQEIEKYKRSKIPFSILFMDLDHFKMVNDSKGHLVGSGVLKQIGAIVKNSVRAIDSCFRYGGDEFLAVLSNTNIEQAKVVAGRICEQIRSTTFLVRGEKINVTVSIGVATFPIHAKTKEKILEVADEAMYCGKNLSRNIVYIAS